MKQRVLVIEDNPPNLELMLYLLKAYGLQGEGSSTAMDGLARAQAQTFDLFLCDIQLPDLDGIEVAKRLKQRQPNTPIVAVTALAMIGDQERLLASGFDGYISKPLDPKTFVSKLQPFIGAPELAPTMTTAVSSPAAVEQGLQSEPSQGHTVLVIDDQEESRYLLLTVLKINGFAVLEASTAADGMRLAVEKHPAAIVCDVNMPDEDGEAFLLKKQAHPIVNQIPVIMITSSDNPSPPTRRRFKELGAKALLTRPLDSRSFIDMVGGVISERGRA
jgi:two-component system, cell cycle response regulator